jgi:hypothetical protein
MTPVFSQCSRENEASFNWIIRKCEVERSGSLMIYNEIK